MKRLVLMGNPNVGKSLVFARLTGAGVISSNYPGTTVEFTSGKIRLGGELAEVIDAPGTYSLQPSSDAERVAQGVLEIADLVVNVVDATNMERNLLLTLELLEQGKPLVVALNLWDEARHTGISIDVPALERLLGAPVVPVVALTGEGFRDLMERIRGTGVPAGHPALSDEERWLRVGAIVREVQTVAHRHHTLRDRLSDATIMPATGIPLAAMVLIALGGAVVLAGEALVRFVTDPLFQLYQGPLSTFAAWLGDGLLREILVGEPVGGKVDFARSMGVLTTGIYIPLGIVLPFIITFYLALALLEDSGYLPRLATLTDTLFHRLGLHGHAVVPLFLSLGCNVPGVLSTRLLETRRQRFIAATLCAVSVPCASKTAMIFGVLGPYGPFYPLLVFSTLAVVYVLGGLLLNRLLPGESTEIFLEIPPYRWPSPAVLAQKTWMRVRVFLAEAIPFMMAGVLVVNLLTITGLLYLVALAGGPLVTGWLGLPGDASIVLLTGLFRRDLAIGMLLSLDLTPPQIAIATTTLTMLFPCMATFVVLARELGIRDMLLSVLFMAGLAFLTGGVMKILLVGV
jgi:ferrous iron transport protein B